MSEVDLADSSYLSPVSHGVGVSRGVGAASDPKNIQDLTSFVGTLLGQMQERFQQMSDQIIGRIDDMGGRIDDLEKNIGDLMTQAGMEEPERSDK